MRAVPVPGPLRVAARCRHVSGGWFDEESEVWDAAGRLVAQSRQIARVGPQFPAQGRYGTLLIFHTSTEPRTATTAVPANSVG